MRRMSTPSAGAVGDWAFAVANEVRRDTVTREIASSCCESMHTNVCEFFLPWPVLFRGFRLEAQGVLDSSESREFQGRFVHRGSPTIWGSVPGFEGRRIRLRYA